MNETVVAAARPDLRDGRPTKAETLRTFLLQLIEVELRPHDRLPTERDLAERFEISRLTARQVLSRLEVEGRIYREQGSGSFVSEPRIVKSVELTSFSEDMRSRGLVPGSHLLEAEIVAAGADIGTALDMSPRSMVAHIRRSRTADGIPMCLEDSYFPADLVPGLLDADLEQSVYELLDSRFHIRVQRADQSIRVTVLDAQQARVLDASEFAPAFDVRRTSFDSRGQRCEYARSIYRGDRYYYDLTVYRD